MGFTWLAERRPDSHRDDLSGVPPQIAAIVRNAGISEKSLPADQPIQSEGSGSPCR